MQMTFAAMLINALHAPFENREVALKRVGVNLATPVLARAVINIFVARKILVQVRILASFVGHDRCFFCDVGAKDRNKMRSRRALYMERTNSPAALDKRQDRVLVRKAAMLRHIRFLADEGFINFNDISVAAKRHKLAAAHCLAQPMRHKPSGSIRNAESAMDLMAAHALFVGAEHVRRLKPKVQFDVAGLKHGANRHSELTLAMAATLQAHASRLAADDSNPIQATAARA